MTAAFFALLIALPGPLGAQDALPENSGPAGEASAAPAANPAVSAHDAGSLGLPIGGFLEAQLEYPRVRRALAARGERVESRFREGGVTDVAEVFFRVFKREQVLEVWARDRGASTFVLVHEVPICKLSGRLGPKRRQGDRQIPEGFYHIDLFNPWSSYHLSMRVNYPNPVDRVRGAAGRLGGDIYIHGDCVTIGCVPVTDEWIEELYLIAGRARDAGQDRIPVHIFPTRLDDAGMRRLTRAFGPDYVHIPFWHNLQEGFLAFERTRTVPVARHDAGRYTFTTPVLQRPPTSR